MSPPQIPLLPSHRCLHALTLASRHSALTRNKIFSTSLAFVKKAATQKPEACSISKASLSVDGEVLLACMTVVLMLAMCLEAMDMRRWNINGGLDTLV